MGRIFCSIIADSHGWHDTVCGTSNKALIAEKFGERNYQQARNQWHQNGYNAFLVELAKYGLGNKDMAANLNLFSKVSTDAEGNLCYAAEASPAGSELVLRFEMDTLVVMHTCPHPLHPQGAYPFKPVQLAFELAEPVADDDCCLTHCAENGRGFANNALYHLGVETEHSGGCCHGH